MDSDLGGGFAFRLSLFKPFFLPLSCPGPLSPHQPSNALDLSAGTPLLAHFFSLFFSPGGHI